MGMFSGFGGGGGDNSRYHYELQQWLKDQEDATKLDQLNAIRSSYGPVIDEQLAHETNPQTIAGLKMARAGLNSAAPDALNAFMQQLGSSQSAFAHSGILTDDQKEFGQAQREGYTGGMEQWLAQQHRANTPAALQVAQARADSENRPVTREDIDYAAKITTPGLAYNIENQKEVGRLDANIAKGRQAESEKVGGAEETKRVVDHIDNAPKAIGTYAAHIDAANRLLGLANQLDDYTALNPTATGAFSDTLAKLPVPSSAKEWANIRDSIQSQLSLETINALKLNSPTGATGFGAMSESELMIVNNAIANLEQATTPQQITENLARLREVVGKSRERAISDWKGDSKWYLDNRHLAPNLAREIQQYDEAKYAAPQATPRPKSMDETMALPPGTVFIDPKGVRRTR